MTIAATPDTLDTRGEMRLLLGLLGRIAAIVFTVEAGVMVFLAGGQLSQSVIAEGLLDSTLLTVIASPLIFTWAAKPFVVAAHEAQAALSRELDARARQSLQLEATLDELKHLLVQNEQLRGRLQQSSVEFSSINERTLQRIGADLHDGPAQLVSFALLRLHRFMPVAPVPHDGEDTTAARIEDLRRVRDALDTTLREVRNISSGLALPELDALSLEETIFLAIGAHEERSDTTVTFDIGTLPAAVAHPMKVCAYRLVQEGLANALRHAGARGQRVEARIAEGSELMIVIADAGPGMELPPRATSRGLGLPGLRGRVEALGGTFMLHSDRGRGTAIVAQFPLDSLNKTGPTDV